MNKIINIKNGNNSDDTPGLLSFLEKFSTEEACINHLIESRWHGKITCPYCEHDKVYKIQKGRRFKCAKCRTHFSPTAKTFFGKSKIPLRKWYLAIFFITTHKKGYNSIKLGKDLGVTQTTAWFMAMKIRTVMKKCKNNAPLFGIVEIDEAYLGRKKKLEPGQKRRKRGLGTTKMPIIGMVERGGRVIAVPLKGKPNAAIIREIAHKFISDDADIMTDGSVLYRGYDKEFKSHQSVNHSEREYARGDVNTNSIEGFWSQSKNGMLITHHSVSDKYMDLYCDEFAHRYSTRNEKVIDRFNDIIDKGDQGYISQKDIHDRTPELY